MTGMWIAQHATGVSVGTDMMQCVEGKCVMRMLEFEAAPVRRRVLRAY